MTAAVPMSHEYKLRFSILDYQIRLPARGLLEKGLSYQSPRKPAAAGQMIPGAP